ncbi:MAG: hypothetical protein WC617_13715 [Rhodanobacter sp.]
MKVHLLIDIHMLDVELALSTYGIVVIETTRPHAAQIGELARARLFPDGPTFAIDGYDEYPDTLNLLAVNVPPDRGWVHYLIYSKVFPYHLERAQDLVRAAVSNWPGRDNYVYPVPS